MKTLSNGGEILRSSLLVKISVAVFVAFASFYIGTRWSDGYQQLALFSSKQYFAITSKTHWVAISPNMDKDFDLSSLIGDNQTQAVLDSTSLSNPPPSPPPLQNSTSEFPPPQPPPPPPPASIQRFGVVDENGTMSVDFEVGEFDPEYVENWGNASATQVDAGNSKPSIRVMKYPMCPETRREYIPCLDNLEAIRQLKSTERGEKFERHCPENGRGLNCLVPQPKGYKVPFGWPRSRDQVWPHTRLVKDKRGQNRISKENGMFKFPGGGTQFIHGADQYIDQIEKMVPGIAFGRRTRVALDVGCGVASFGAYLLSRNVITMSIAPKDSHGNQIQFALERGMPAMAAAFATRRLLYPSQGFELIHCSRCRINWIRDDGILLLEANRMLRGGGYFVWAAQPVYKHEESLEEQWKEMVNLTARMCWELVKKDNYIAIWQKPLNNSCYLSRELGIHPPLCNGDDDPDKVWYVDLKACITWLPENGYGTNVRPWPERLENPPHRLRSIEMDAYISREELFKAESKYWRDIINGYVHVFRWKKLRLRNVMDMRAGFGGFAAALLAQPIDCWVMNVVPISGPNTLPVLYDRGLIGVMHDWCEPFDTYPRTYDFLHAAGLFTVEQRRCDISRIMVEMDRILRPGGHVYIRDSTSVVYELQRIAEAMGWHAGVRETAEGRHASYRILTCDKPLRRS